MTPFVHKSIVSVYVVVVVTAIVVLLYFGFSYYILPLEERCFHPDYNLLKPTGFVGHGLGVVGTFLILVGLFGYMARKRLKTFSNLGMLQYWLELHVFLCTLGAVFVLFHTTYKFAGIASVGFWSLVIVWVSGVVGRFLYISIPRNIEGRELTLTELQQIKLEYEKELFDKYKINISQQKKNRFSQIKQKLIAERIPRSEFRKVRKLLRGERILLWRIRRLETLRSVFKHWHVIHLPFALIMLIMLAIHVGIALYFGYSWILFK